MGSNSTPSVSIPAIDFPDRSLNPKTPEWESVKAQVMKALREFGCFEASYDRIPINLREKEIFEATKELFDLPLEIKHLNVSSKPLYSYRSYGKNTPGTFQHEALILENANIYEKVERFTSVSWPKGNPSFCETIYSYSEQVSEFSKIITRMVFESLGIEKHFDEHLESSNYVLRLIKYEHPETDGTKMEGLADHTDKNYISILSENQVNGLEVRTKDGQWIPVKPSPGSFVVLLGEVFSHVLTNDRLHCPVHRVMMSGHNPRYSAVIFSNPNEDYLIKTPEEMVDEKHPLAYKPFYYFDFVKFFLTVGKGHPSALRAYCGV